MHAVFVSKLGQLCDKSLHIPDIVFGPDESIPGTEDYRCPRRRVVSWTRIEPAIRPF